MKDLKFMKVCFNTLENMNFCTESYQWSCDKVHEVLDIEQQAPIHNYALIIVATTPQQ